MSRVRPRERYNEALPRYVDERTDWSRGHLLWRNRRQGSRGLWRFDVDVTLADAKDEEQTVEITSGRGRIVVELPPGFDGRFDLDDYIDYVISMLHALNGDTHIVGVCQPSVPVLAAVSLMAQHGNAKQGDDQAQCYYARNLLALSGEKAAPEAVQWLQKSAAQGNDDAQFRHANEHS